MQLQGYLLGNPVSDSFIDVNERIPYVHRVSLISDEIYEAAKTNCSGDYVNVELNNTLCVTALQKIKDCLLQINLAQILEPQCAFASGRTTELEWDLRAREASIMDYLLSESKLHELHCRWSFSSEIGGVFVIGRFCVDTFHEEKSKRERRKENKALTMELLAVAYSSLVAKMEEIIYRLVMLEFSATQKYSLASNSTYNVEEAGDL
ncbi:serine carboxypeptidase-like 20 [Rosa rugosa]|nr:serine carboxypeptidase-like 20 [Rosa rugosa]